MRRDRVGATVNRYGVACVTPSAALAQAVPECDRTTAVVLMDSARSSGLLDDEGFATARELSRGRRGAARSRQWWGESDPGSQSPAETWARLTCTDAGFRPDVLQLAVRKRSGRFLARVDLAWALPDGRWLLGEVDGVAYHSERRDVAADLARQNSILTDRTLLRRWTGTEARNGRLASEVAAILGPSGWTPVPSAPSTLVLD